MSDHHDENDEVWKVCERKRPYRTYYSALYQLEEGRKKKLYTAQHEPYTCKFCGKWHIGRHTRRKGKT